MNDENSQQIQLPCVIAPILPTVYCPNFVVSNKIRYRDFKADFSVTRTRWELQQITGKLEVWRKPSQIDDDFGSLKNW